MDANFIPYTPQADKPTSKTDARVCVLKFTSSAQRHMFWLQSKPENDDKAKFSDRELKIIKIVDAILNGEEVDVKEELASVGRGNGDEDETMEDIEGHGEPGTHHEGSSGGAGPDATGGDVRQEGESSREGGADGGRA